MFDPHQKLDELENELIDIEMCLQTSQGDCRETLLARRRNIFTSIARLNEKIGTVRNKRGYADEDYGDW